ncbi:MAG: hypothetical protein R2705_22405 [Ilumatobacteraceae bacterium]
MTIDLLDAPGRDFARVLRVHRTGRFDPTVEVEPGGWWWATLTPHGPGTLHIWWGSRGVDAEAWGDGASWLLDRVCGLLGEDDRVVPFTSGHPQVLAAQRNHPDLRFGHSDRLYHTMLPIVIGQRVTTREARRSWTQLVRAAGQPAPGPRPLRLPPEPSVLARQPYWWFHRFGIERHRADALRTVAAHAALLDRLDQAGDIAAARTDLARLPGIGAWTIGCSLGPALGDADAVAVGDFWVPHQVCWALAGEARGSDERMLELLEPYRGQRGRAVALLAADGWRAPRFGPGQRIIPIASW